MDGERCGNCRFWKEHEDFNDDNDEEIVLLGEGVCRRYPPMSLVENPTKDHHSFSCWAYPVTHLREWCGEWQISSPNEFAAMETWSTGLSVRARKALLKHGAKLLGGACEIHESDLLVTRNCGVTTTNEIKAYLKKCGLSLKSELPIRSPQSSENVSRSSDTPDIAEPNRSEGAGS